jgi:superfamily II DNA or RNA helicase
LISNLNNIHHCICYCSPEQKDSILSILGIENNISTHQFTYRENNVLRQDILDQFNEGILQVIVAIKCLDEGVDVPSSKLAFFLANSTNPREFIQRRGRVLRNYKNKDFAYLYDFLTVPPVNEDYSIQELNRSILRKELNRFSLFANSSENKHAAYEVIWKIAKTFGVLDFSED